VVNLAYHGARILGLLLALAAPAMAIEQPRYTVVDREGDVEIRQYEPYMVAETFVDAQFDSAGNEGFRRLFRYIAGDNRSGTEISMTAPVAQRQAGTRIDMTSPVGQVPAEGGYWVSFVVPASFTPDTVPQPTDDRVAIREVPAQLMAVGRYAGTWRADRYQSEEKQLLAKLHERGLSVAGPASFARYNPPFMPPFLRRNEILVPLRGEFSRASGFVPVAVN
jgi:hypothetical protein